MRYALKKGGRIYFSAEAGGECYSYRLLKNVKVFEENLRKNGKRKQKGSCSHVLVARRPLKNIMKGEKIEGYGNIYEYCRKDGSKDFSFKITSVKPLIKKKELLA